MNQMQIFSLVLILYCQNIFHAWGQQTPAGDSKRKASEYFCVAQCLGLLGTDRPGQACYEESAKMTMKNNKQCEDQSYEKVPDCCKDVPAELLQLPPGDDECPKISKSVGSSMALFLSTYVLTGPTNMAGRLDFSGAELSKRHGGKLAYMDCLFVKRKLIKDGAIDFLAAKNDFETNVTNSTWRNVVSNAYISCQYLLAGNSNIPKTISVQIDGVTKDWRTTAGLLYQCIRREMIENCPFKSLTSSACKDIDNNVYMCNPFK
ncbi:uncharacterized protein LOC132196140 [Neocloeon triangulifer]|uniref:uncharacterized protein LOC132196140 n=1 Tax=Neocloeon triangulifer TaxID=2078957 RepID=UPI00286F41D1|nr:uncharacterized protein LOC132196140 [Neocloeon triangulifer]